MAWRTLRAASKVEANRKLQLTVEGYSNVPDSGGVLLAVRHYHHLFDGVALLATLNRTTSIVVGLDWMTSGLMKRTMLAACRSAGWPVVVRSQPALPVDPAVARSQLRVATRQAVQLLQSGRILIVFPEAYPTIDPVWTPKSSPTDVLPFEPGVVRFAKLAAPGKVPIPILPVGLEYEEGPKTSVTIRFGEAFRERAGERYSDTAQRLRAEVIRLSGLDYAANTASAATTSLGDAGS